MCLHIKQSWVWNLDELNIGFLIYKNVQILKNITDPLPPNICGTVYKHQNPKQILISSKGLTLAEWELCSIQDCKFWDPSWVLPLLQSLSTVPSVFKMNQKMYITPSRESQGHFYLKDMLFLFLIIVSILVCVSRNKVLDVGNVFIYNTQISVSTCSHLEHFDEAYMTGFMK